MKIGLLGGSFNPPHSGHVAISKDALNFLNLDQVWWLPTKQNPLKDKTNSSFEKRIIWCQEITKNEPKILVKDLEKNLSSNYFIDLLELILKQHPDQEFYFLIGADNLANFHLWRRWQDIVNLVKIVVFERENFVEKYADSEVMKSPLIFLENQKYNISSTAIREQIMSGKGYLVDSHCHLDLLAEKGVNIDEIVANAKANNVAVLQTICTRISKFENIHQYALKYENVFASVGNHPCNVAQEKPVKATEIIAICNNNRKVIGIGETGLDYYHDASFKDQQKESFLEHIEAARQTGLPLIIHNRDSDLDMIEILKSEMKKGQFKALLHCFSSSEELALEALKIGIYISISGIVTFKNAVPLQEIVKQIPLDKLLVETDAPYLAPIPYRGQMNQPAYTRNTAQFIANLRGIHAQELFNITTQNFFNLFSKCSV